MQTVAEFVHTIGQLDRDLFLFLNGLHADALDDLFVLLSNRWVWIPLYAFLLYNVIRKYKKRSVYVVIAAVLLITLSDQISVQLFKNVVQRLRPCHDERLIPFMHLVNNSCGGRYGFISSHAANVFALAVFFTGVFHEDSRWWAAGLLFWAVLVSYSRIYLGVHYPMDLICGAIVGAGLAFFMYRLLLVVFRWSGSKIRES